MRAGQGFARGGGIGVPLQRHFRRAAQARCDVTPGSHVLRFFLRPDDLDELRIDRRDVPVRVHEHVLAVRTRDGSLKLLEESLRLIERYEPPPVPSPPITVQAGVGMACTEAPRGILYHRYRVDDEGIVREAKIVPPTSQNQAAIEADLVHAAGDALQLPDAEVTHEASRRAGRELALQATRKAIAMIEADKDPENAQFFALIRQSADGKLKQLQPEAAKQD